MRLRKKPGEEIKMTNPLIVTNSKSTVILAAASAGSFMGWGVRIG
ncbi:MAG TPA: hypothetical protein VJN22_05115 [Candidatus Eremiobacteraceae bacterium]|nr:hypothetical protein [Candidatus Eremiobacteraceae bacterium]